MSQLGWVRDDEAVGIACEEMAAAGLVVGFGDANPALKGHWPSLVARGHTGKFLQLAEGRVLQGPARPCAYQRRGTCVGQGTYRAVQDTLYRQIDSGEIGLPIEVAYEPIYGGSRVNIGKGKIRGDGSIGAWAAQWLAMYGLTPRDNYGSVDLSQPNEDLAVRWGNPGAGVPREVIEASKQFPVAAHQCDTVDDIADALAAGYGVAFCADQVYGDTRDQDGFTTVASRGGHCEELCGVLLTRDGDLAFQRQGSWGRDWPRGPGVLRFKGGAITLRPGSYGVRADDIATGLRNGGEAWAVKVLGLPRGE